MSVILISQLSFHGIAWIIILSLAHLIPSSSYVYCEGEFDYNETIFVHPYSAWSNVSFFIVAWLESILLFYMATQNRELVYTIISPFTILHLGLASFIYHSILFAWTGYWDVIAIYVYLTFETGTSVSRVLYLWGWSGFSLEAWRFSTWILLSILFSVLTYTIQGFNVDTAIVTCVGVSSGIALVCEAIILYLLRAQTTLSGYALYVGVIIFGIPAIFMWTYGSSPHPSPCDNNVHYIGHGTWHILISISIFLLFLTRLFVVPERSSKVGVKSVPIRRVKTGL